MKKKKVIIGILGSLLLLIIAGVIFSYFILQKYLPEYEDISKEFKEFKNRWVQLSEDMFYVDMIKLTPKEGVDEEKAMKHIISISTSDKIKHEHKVAGCAFLFNEWFSGFIWKDHKCPDCYRTGEYVDIAFTDKGCEKVYCKCNRCNGTGKVGF